MATSKQYSEINLQVTSPTLRAPGDFPMTNPSLQSKRIPNMKHYSTINLFEVWFCVVSGYLKLLVALRSQ